MQTQKWRLPPGPGDSCNAVVL
jgi:hypothetical protein